MAIWPVLQLGDPRLRMMTESVIDPATPEVATTINDLRDTLAHWRTTTTYGRGIAAPQIGVLRRIVFVDMDRPWPLINPEITGRSAETMVVWEEWHQLRAEGELAELLQHEIDHLDGILALDRITDVRTICVREEFERRYRCASPYAQPVAD
ncbi:MAG: Peptide deformylase [Thermomicrobiales bacterium]|nr:Peptide deformylase [Thermomicrobiales bacterium]